VFVFDTSAYINGWNHHYSGPSFEPLWVFVADAMEDGRIVSPRAVHREIQQRTDALAGWARNRRFVDPNERVQRLVGQLQVQFPEVFSTPGRNDADPWVIALAQADGLTVVTYEGRQFSGAPARRSRFPKMPEICATLGVSCVNPSEALNQLGFRL
jgi:hypothetical protein